jgi:hypothetical protein
VCNKSNCQSKTRLSSLYRVPILINIDHKMLKYVDLKKTSKRDDFFTCIQSQQVGYDKIFSELWGHLYMKFGNP